MVMVMVAFVMRQYVFGQGNGHGLGKRDETSYLLTKKMVMVLEE